jgi:hypothetical protein
LSANAVTAFEPAKAESKILENGVVMFPAQLLRKEIP